MDPANKLTPRPWQRSFLVTSIGAYGDSGIGTGGFVCVNEGHSVIVDKIDSTGLWIEDGIVYRFVRGLQKIVGYGTDGIQYQLSIPEAHDVHDIALMDGVFICVATGTNEVLWIDSLGRLLRRWKAEGDGDAWHLNCLWREGKQLFFSAFGRFPTHRGWLGKCKGSGMIFEFDSQKDVVCGLNGPHNPRLIGNQWVVCDSHVSALEIQNADGTRRTVQLDGFTRGLAYDDDYFYIGESANRKAEKPAETSAVAVVDRRNLEVVERITIPFPEIYEIVAVSPEFATNVVSRLSRFQIDASGERIRLLEEQVELGIKHAAEWKLRVDNLRVPEAIWSRLVDIKRLIVG